MASTKTINAVSRTLAATLSAAADGGKLPSNPFAGIKQLPAARVDRRPMSDDEAERLRAELPMLRDRVL